MPNACHYGVSARVQWPGVIILPLAKIVSLICKLYLRMAAGKIHLADPSVRYILSVAEMEQAKEQNKQT